MDKELFESRIAPLGEVTIRPKSKRTANSTSDMPESYTWQKFPTEKICNDCGKQVVDRQVIYVLKSDSKDNPYWWKRCSACPIRTKVIKPFV